MKNVTLQGERMKTELILQYICKNKLNKTSFCRLVGFSVSVLDKILKQGYDYDAFIFEFKVQDGEEKDLGDTVREALRQIEEKDYQAALRAKGIPEERIRAYGFAFCGKRVLIGGGKYGRD